MDALQFSVIRWLFDELEDFVITSRNVEEDEMSLNYAIRDIVMDRGADLYEGGIDVYRGRAYNSGYGMLSSVEDGQIRFRTVEARAGGFYENMLSRDTDHWTHGYKQNPDLILCARDRAFFLRAELKAPGDQPNVRCWNAPFRKEVLKDVDQHINHDPNSCLLMVMSEMAFRRSRGEPWEDSYLYRQRVRGGVPPVGHTIPFPSIDELIAAGALENSVEDTLRWRWFCRRTNDCRNERCRCHGERYNPEPVPPSRTTEFRVLYRLYPQTAMQARQFTRGTDSYHSVGAGFVCTACEFSGLAGDIEQHYREEHSELRTVRTPEYRVVVAITQPEPEE